MMVNCTWLQYSVPGVGAISTTGLQPPTGLAGSIMRHNFQILGFLNHCTVKNLQLHSKLNCIFKSFFVFSSRILVFHWDK